jgi:HSP20 family protein
MRYRRLSYRYVVLSGRPPRPLAAFSLTDHPHLAQTLWEPPADVYETRDTSVATIEIAGVEEEKLDLLLYQDALVLEGTRKCPRPEDDATYHLAEIREGRFRLELTLPAMVDPERVHAVYEGGLLTIKLMKAGA